MYLNPEFKLLVLFLVVSDLFLNVLVKVCFLFLIPWFSDGGQENGRNVQPRVAQQGRRSELYFASRQWDLMSRHWLPQSASTCLNQRPICPATEMSCARLTGQ